MPVTVTPTQPGNILTPWGQIDLSSDFIGPLPSGSFWFIQMFIGPTFETPWYQIQIPTQAPTLTTTFLADGSTSWGTQTLQPKTGDQVLIRANLQEALNVILDTGTATVPWDPTTGMPTQLRHVSSTTGGGLTDEQALQLSETHASTFPTQLLDNITLQPLTNGPTEGPVNSGLLHFTFGVIVRIANVPSDLVPGTPDGDYWFESLAVVRVFRGADLWLRVPVHTSSKLINFVEQNVVAGLAEVTGTLWLLNMSVQTTFRAGVTGEVFLMVFP